MSSLKSSARWLAAAQVGKIVLQLLSMAILARLLSPSHYGVMALAYMVINFASLFRDLGTSAAIIQSRQLSDELKTSVFWLSSMLGLLLFALLALLAHPLALYYAAPDLDWVLALGALSFPIAGSTAIHQALLERSANFRVLTFVEVGAQAAGLGTAIAAALAGWGVYSLVVQILVITVTSATALVCLSPWRPKGPPRLQTLKSLMGFSGNLTGFSLINFVSRNADTAIIGRMLGAMPLGVYSLAYKLMLFPLQSITYVANRALFPELSKHQDDKIAFRALYFDAVHYVSLLAFPVMAGMWVARQEMVSVVFGSKWADLPAVLAWLAPAGIVQAVVSTTGTVFMAQGRTDVLFRLGLGAAVALVTAFVVGANTGIVAVAMCYFAANIFNFVPQMYFTLRQMDSRITQLLPRLLPASASCLIMISVCAGLNVMMASLPDLVRLAAMALAGAASYACSLSILFKPSWSVLTRSLR